MEKYFEVDGKIAENRQRLRELFENYKKIESYYAIFFAYVALIGVYSFDLIQFFLGLVNPQMICFIGLLLTIHIGLFGTVLIIFMQVIYLKSFANDQLPKDIYNIVFKQVESGYSDLSEDKIKLKTKEIYLNELEQSVEDNFNIYKDKKKRVGILIKVMSYSFIIYIVFVSIFKINTMSKKPDVPPPTPPKQEQPAKKQEPIIVVPKRNTNEGDSTRNNKGGVDS